MVKGTVISEGNRLGEFVSANELAIVVLTLPNGAEIISLVISLLPELLETEARLHLRRLLRILGLASASLPNGTGVKARSGIVNVSGAGKAVDEMEIDVGSKGTGGDGEAQGIEDGGDMVVVDRDNERTREANCRGHSARIVREARTKCARVRVNDNARRRFMICCGASSLSSFAFSAIWIWSRRGCRVPRTGDSVGVGSSGSDEGTEGASRVGVGGGNRGVEGISTIGGVVGNDTCNECDGIVVGSCIGIVVV
jgi:hypothetical protein